MFILKDGLYINPKKISWIVADIENSNVVRVMFDNGLPKEFTFQYRKEVQEFVEALQKGAE